MGNNKGSNPTPVQQETICRVVREGSYLSTACKIAGLRFTLVRSWLRRGSEALEAEAHEGTQVPDELLLLADFVRAFESADGQAEHEAVQRLIHPANVLELKAVVKWLGLRHPINWAGRKAIEVIQETGSTNAEPISDEKLDKMLGKFFGQAPGKAPVNG